MDVPARIGRHRRRVALLVAATTAALCVSAVPPSSVGAVTSPVDPAALPRGADPAVVHLVRDTIRDGARRVPATKRGEHEALWVVAGGYLLRDYNVGPRGLTRVVHVSPTGERRVVARSRQWIEVRVSATGQRIATQVWPTDLGERSIITVSQPRTGAVVARRELRLATLAAVTGTRVLLGRRAHWKDPATVWWNYERDTLRRLHGQAAIDADVVHDKVVFERSSVGEFCNRVAVLSHPASTLWSSCQVYPHQWSPDGSRAVATHTYFDAAGTDRWWVVDGRTAQKQARITGRLDWDAVWEDDEHFLTKAQSEAGKAAVVRCDLAGTCERASRVWDVPLPEDSLYYAPPPVVLADR
jgi:hypothetical protein